MKLEQQVTNREISQRLKELGVKQESLFHHFQTFWKVPEANNPIGTFQIHQSGYIEMREGYWIGEIYSAFTVADLGEMLPDEYPGESDSMLVIFKTQALKLTNWYVRYENDVMKSVSHAEFADSEADARGKTLIYLLENKLIPNVA